MLWNVPTAEDRFGQICDGTVFCEATMPAHLLAIDWWRDGELRQSRTAGFRGLLPVRKGAVAIPLIVRPN